MAASHVWVAVQLLEEPAHTNNSVVPIKKSAEAELYAAALGASESKKELCRCWRICVTRLKPMLAIDAKATERILHKQGICRLNHLGVAILVDAR